MLRSSKVRIVLCVHLVLIGQAFTFTAPCSLRYSTPETLIRPRKSPLSILLQSTSKDEIDDAPESKSPNSSRRKPSIPVARRPIVESGLRYRSDDWLGNFISLPNSFVLLRIRFHLLSNTIITAIVILLNRFVFKIQVPLIGHSLMGSFLGLLLVFRTNSAYARFWEARGVWTKTLTNCRSMALSIANYMNYHSPKSAARLMELLYHFPEVLSYNCLPTGLSKLSDQVERLLGKDNLKSEILPSTLLLHRMHQAIHDASLESTTCQSNYVEAMHLVEVSHLIGSLGDSVSHACKILKTPVPLSYSRHTSRFLTIWSGTLPLALVGQLGLVTLPVMVITCWCLFGIEEIGHLIEQPFVGDADKDLGSITWPNNSIFAMFPLVRRATYTKPYDIGIPVQSLARKVQDELKEIASLAGMAV